MTIDPANPSLPPASARSRRTCPASRSRSSSASTASATASSSPRTRIRSGRGRSRSQRSRRRRAEIGLYPDGSGFTLKQALARKHGCGARVHHARQRLERRAGDARGGVSDAAERSGLFAVRVCGLSDRRAGNRRDRARRPGVSRRRTRCRSGTTSMPWRGSSTSARGSCSSRIRTIRRAPGLTPTRCGASSRRCRDRRSSSSTRRISNT